MRNTDLTKHITVALCTAVFSTTMVLGAVAPATALGTHKTGVATAQAPLSPVVSYRA